MSVILSSHWRITRLYKSSGTSTWIAGADWYMSFAAAICGTVDAHLSNSIWLGDQGGPHSEIDLSFRRADRAEILFKNRHEATEKLSKLHPIKGFTKGEKVSLLQKKYVSPKMWVVSQLSKCRLQSSIKQRRNVLSSFPSKLFSIFALELSQYEKYSANSFLAFSWAYSIVSYWTINVKFEKSWNGIEKFHCLFRVTP